MPGILFTLLVEMQLEFFFLKKIHTFYKKKKPILRFLKTTHSLLSAMIDAVNEHGIVFFSYSDLWVFL